MDDFFEKYNLDSEQGYKISLVQNELASVFRLRADLSENKKRFIEDLKQVYRANFLLLNEKLKISYNFMTPVCSSVLSCETYIIKRLEELVKLRNLIRADRPRIADSEIAESNM